MAMALELEHMIGFNGSASSPLHVHPNGSDVVYAQGGCIVIADLRDPHKQDFLRGHDDTVTCLALSASGRTIVSGQKGDNCDVVVWDFETRQEIYRFQEHDAGVAQVELSADERFLLSVGNEKDKKLVVWDLQTGCIVVSKTNLKVAQLCACWGGRKKDAKRRETTQYQLATGGASHLTFWTMDPMAGTMTGEECTLGNQVRCATARQAATCDRTPTRHLERPAHARARPPMLHCANSTAAPRRPALLRRASGALLLLAGLLAPNPKPNPAGALLLLVGLLARRRLHLWWLDLGRLHRRARSARATRPHVAAHSRLHCGHTSWLHLRAHTFAPTSRPHLAPTPRAHTSRLRRAHAPSPSHRRSPARPRALVLGFARRPNVGVAPPPPPAERYGLRDMAGQAPHYALDDAGVLERRAAPDCTADDDGRPSHCGRGRRVDQHL